jgi:hypothetical protein
VLLGFLKRPKKSKKDTRRDPIPNTDEEYQDAFECLAARLKANNMEKHLQCLDCPVCLTSKDLQAALIHNCSGNGGKEIAVPPGENCGWCDFVSNALCLCDICNVAPHTMEFRIEPDPYDDVVYPKYPKHAQFKSAYDKKRREAYNKQHSRMLVANNEKAHFSNVTGMQVAHLNNLLSEPDGYVVLAELCRAVPGFLEQVGASEEVKRKVGLELEKDQLKQGTFSLNPNASYRLTQKIKNFDQITKAAADRGVEVTKLIESIGRHNSVRNLSERQRQMLRDAADTTRLAHMDFSVDADTTGDSSSSSCCCCCSSGSGWRSGEEVGSDLYTKRRRVGDAVASAAVPLSHEAQQIQKTTCAFFMLVPHCIYQHFSSLSSSSSSSSTVDQKVKLQQYQDLYTNCKISLQQLLTLCVSENRTMAEKVFSLVGTVSHFKEEEIQENLSKCVLVINQSIGVLNQSLQHPILALDLGEPIASGNAHLPFPE